MRFASVRIVTEDIRRLVAFYEGITGLTAAWAAPDLFAEIRAGSATLAFSSTSAIQRFQPEAGARPAANQSVILELRVEDVDADFRRIAPLVGKAVQEPTTMPWGNRSLLFRDPDGNLVNFFTPVSDTARARNA